MANNTPYTLQIPGSGFSPSTIPNSTRLTRNPNSPEAIAARQAGLQDPTAPISLELITDKKAGTIFIDLTTNSVDQRIGFILTGGGRKNRRLVRNIVGSKNGRLTITSYYIDVDNKQWIIVSGYGNEIQNNQAEPHPEHFPLSTYPGITDLGAGAPGENWRNQGRSVDLIKANVSRQFKRTPVDNSSNQAITNPIDEFLDDFTGNA